MESQKEIMKVKEDHQIECNWFLFFFLIKTFFFSPELYMLQDLSLLTTY